MKSLLVSVNYSDYLQCILEMNTKTFEEIIVVTVQSDTNCQKVCEQYSSVTCIVVPDKLLKMNGATFNKGVLLNCGMEHLMKIKYTGYLCLTDSDIIFNNFKHRITHHLKNISSLGIDCKSILLGMSRYIIKDRDDYVKWKANPALNYTFLSRLETNKERTLLGYAQIFYFKHDDDWRDHNNHPVWRLDTHCVNAQQVDARFIGNFLNRTKKQSDWRDSCAKDTPVYKFERIKYNNTEGLEYGVHVEDDEMYCIHVGETWTNRDGRVTKSWHES